MDNAKKARAVGFNHVALEVGDIAEALAFYRRLFDFELRARALVRPSSIWATHSWRFRKEPADGGRHFGLVVDDKDAVRNWLADIHVAFDQRVNWKALASTSP